MKKEIIINLSQSVSIPSKGEVLEGHAIKIFSPCQDQMEWICVLDEAMSLMIRGGMKDLDTIKSLGGLVDKSEDKKSEETSQDADGTIESLKLYLTSDQMLKCHRSISQILRSGKKAEIDGISVNEQIIKLISIEDMKTILGEYIVNFIVSSQKTNKK